ncbi:MAG: hypothetical protein JSV51_07355 [Candidatus Bathyarchaeota archaeon]|nr:MAG: hypothetical protein JSV51_07355 [Candidatus Bathyarchaeota archaeon]
MSKKKLGKMTLHVTKSDPEYYKISILDQLGDKIDSMVVSKEKLETTIEEQKKHWENHNYEVEVNKHAGA